MSRFGLGRRGQSGRHMTFFRRRRPDDWDSQHERARVLSALELVERLPATDATWLAEHFEDCQSCHDRAAVYAEDQALLRTLRDAAPEPPRDLWARTAAAIEDEAARSERRARLSLLQRIGAVPLGAASGVLVVLVVIGVTLFGNPAPDIAKSPPSAPVTTPDPQATPGPTPLVVPPNQVAWVQLNQAGTYDLVVAGFDTVCGADLGAGCAPIDTSTGRSIELTRAPGSVILSPSLPQVVVIDASASTTGGAVFIVPVPTVAPSGDPGATPSSSPASPEPSPPSPEPSVSPTDAPGATPSPTPDISVEPTPVATPTPIAEGAIAIIQDVIVVGDGTYSADGSSFAFSARPADGSAGPDVYVWQVGDALARPVTFDHASVFVSWLDDLVLVSRVRVVGVVIDELGPTPTDATPDATADPAASPGIAPVGEGVAVVIDPETGASVELGGSSWRPVVDPSRRIVVHWEGTLVGDEAGISWSLGTGQLILEAWVSPERPVATPDPEATQEPAASASADPAASAAPQDSAAPSAPSASAEPVIVRTVISDGPIIDFDARWDPTGTRLALWIADALDPRIGSLRLFVVDPGTGALSASDDRLSGTPALRGFSIELGRLAWVTPSGQDGEGSRVLVVAWSSDSFGTIESRPGTDVILSR